MINLWCIAIPVFFISISKTQSCICTKLSFDQWSNFCYLLLSLNSIPIVDTIRCLWFVLRRNIVLIYSLCFPGHFLPIFRSFVPPIFGLRNDSFLRSVYRGNPKSIFTPFYCPIICSVWDSGQAEINCYQSKYYLSHLGPGLHQTVDTRLSSPVLHYIIWTTAWASFPSFFPSFSTYIKKYY